MNLQPSRFAIWLSGVGRISTLGLVLLGSTAGAEERYTSLFDGETLDGWHTNREPVAHGTGGRWAVEEGVITGEQDPPGSGNGGLLLSDDKFGEFELLLDIKPDWGVCSGLFLRSTEQGQCFQMMIDYHDGGNIGHLYGEGTGGFNNRPYEIFGILDAQQQLVRVEARPNQRKLPFAYSASPADWTQAWKVGDWNTAKVRVVGNPPHITTWLNGVKISEFDASTFEASNYDQAQVAKTLGNQGHLGLQVHSGQGWPKGAKCRWRNIRIRPLQPE